MRANARFALVFALMAVSLLGNQPAEATTGADLKGWCSGYPNSDRPNKCRAYVGAILDLLEKGYVFEGATACVPEEEPIDGIVLTVMHWFDSHADQESERLGVIVANALSKLYPCPAR